VVHCTDLNAWISDNALYVKEHLMEIDKTYLSRYLEYLDLNKQQNKGSHPLINQSKVLQNHIYLPNKEDEKAIVKKILAIELSVKRCEDKIESTKLVLKSIINQIFQDAY